MLWFNPGSQLDPQDYRSLPSAWMQSLIYVLVACNVGKGNFPYYLSSCLQAAYDFYNHFGKILNLNAQSTFLPLSAICTFSYFTANFDLSSLLFLPSFNFLYPIENFQIPSVPVLLSHCYSLYSSPYSAMRVSGTTFKNRDCVWQLELVPVSIPHAKMLIDGKFGLRSPMRMTYCVTQLSKQKHFMYFAEYKWSENDGIENTDS